MASIKLEGINKSYDQKVLAVDNSNLEVHDGELMVLLGPSGCGKSTTLRIIAGLEKEDSGKILIAEKNVNQIEPKDRDISMVFQSYALYPHMNVFDNMAFGLKMRKTPKAEIKQRVLQVAQSLGLNEVLKRKPKALSGGQRQRVALGRAIIRNPIVFLFDEPLSNLDALLRVEMRREVSKLHQTSQTTMIYVTHDQVEAMTLGTRICVMNQGVIQQVSSPKDIYDKPKNLFVASFIGTPAMNIIKGQLKENIFNESNFTLEIPKSILNQLTSNELSLGIRPEKVKISLSGLSMEVNFKAKIDLIEHLGAEQLLYAKTTNNTYVSKVATDISFKINQEVFIGFDIKDCYFFNHEEIAIY